MCAKGLGDRHAARVRCMSARWSKTRSRGKKVEAKSTHTTETTHHEYLPPYLSGIGLLGR